MTSSPCVIRAADHAGGAHFVCVAASRGVPAVIERRRVTTKIVASEFCISPRDLAYAPTEAGPNFGCKVRSGGYQGNLKVI
jgi:hypothetical protein